MLPGLVAAIDLVRAAGVYVQDLVICSTLQDVLAAAEGTTIWVVPAPLRSGFGADGYGAGGYGYCAYAVRATAEGAIDLVIEPTAVVVAGIRHGLEPGRSPYGWAGFGGRVDTATVEYIVPAEAAVEVSAETEPIQALVETLLGYGAGRLGTEPYGTRAGSVDARAESTVDLVIEPPGWTYDGYEYYQAIEYAACDQETYQQDIVVHRTTGTAYEETVGDLKVWHVYVGDRCKSDYGDIRFTDASGNALAYYLWPDYDSSSARFTVRLEGATTAGTLVIRYGNPTATTTSDGDAVYFFFDQFDGAALDTTKWDQDPKSTVTVSGGTVSVKGIFDGGTFHGIKGKQSFDTQTCRLEIQCLAIPDRFGHIGWADHYRSDLDSNRIMIRVASQGERMGVVKKGGGTPHVFTWVWPVPPKQYGFARSGTSALYYIDGVLSKTYTDSTHVPTVPLSPVINTNGERGAFIIDSVVVRAHSATPPAAITFSGEQETAAVTAQAASYLGYAGWKYGQYEFGF
jgi:hypothetical protein